jgi:hypothetical protein
MDVTDLSDTRVLIPRIRRAIEPPRSTEPELQDSQINAIAADSIAAVIFYSGSLFGKKLEVAERDTKYQAPIAWKTDVPLEETEITAIAAQAALDYFYSFLSTGETAKTAETIADEASNWSWEKSPQALVERLRQLKADRDLAIEVLEQESDASLVEWASFIGERDELTARIVEPWVKGEGPIYNDPRFERSGAFFGESEVL